MELHPVKLNRRGVATALTLNLCSTALRFVLTALPFPPRPLPPLRRWQPPRHRIERVCCRLAVPSLSWRNWDGDWQPLYGQLTEPLQRLIYEPVRVASPSDKRVQASEGSKGQHQPAPASA